MNDLSNAKAAAAKARHQLADTLDAIEDRINVPKRAKELGGKAVSAYQANPIPFIVVGAAVAVTAVGLIAWAIFGRDDD